jgi:hypothetical protein
LSICYGGPARWRPGPKVLLTEELVDFVESGVSILVGTCDAKLRPHGVRAMGAVVSTDRRTITVFVPRAVADRPLADLRENLVVAATFVRPSDHQGLQFKGRLLGHRAATDTERHILERYRAALFEQLFVCGVSRATAKRYAYWPCVALEFEPDALFRQTPGPHAGAAVGSST